MNRVDGGRPGGPLWRPGEPTELQTGIGRPVDPDWAAGVEAVITEAVADYDCELYMRQIPGLIYVTGSEFARFSKTEYQGEESENMATIAIEAYVENLCTRGILTAQAAESISVELEDGIKDQRRHSKLRINGFVYDIASEHYPAGFLLMGEGEAVLHRLGVRTRNQDKMQKELPIRRVGLGVLCSTDRIPFGELRKKINKEVDPCFKLGPVGPVRGVE